MGRTLGLELGLNENSVASIIRLFKNTGRINAIKKRQPRARIIDKNARSLLTNVIAQDVSITLSSMKTKLEEELSISTCIATISNTLEDMSYSLKRVTLIPETRKGINNINVRETYCADYILQDDNTIICIDEFGVSCSTRVSYGRSPIGTPARKNIRAIRSKNILVCAAIMKSGIKSFKISDNPFNQTTFLEYIRILVSDLNILGITSGRMVMDNASIHKSEELRLFLQESGFELRFLPAYSPQLNPIEETFSKWKLYIKQQNARTVKELYTYINTAANLITAEDCQGFFQHVRAFALRGIRREEF